MRDGQITFEQFVDKTRKDFFLLASRLLQRWSSPPWFSVDDAEQELYLGAWNYIWRFEDAKGEAKGVTIERYVVFNAMSQAKRELHRARGVALGGSPDRKISNFEATLSSIGEEGDGDRLLSLLYDPPIAEETIIEHQEKKRATKKMLKVCETVEESVVVLAIKKAGSLDEAGTVLYNNFDRRIQFRLGSESKAEKFVLRHAKALAKRAQEQSNGVTPG